MRKRWAALAAFPCCLALISTPAMVSAADEGATVGDALQVERIGDVPYLPDPDGTTHVLTVYALPLVLLDFFRLLVIAVLCIHGVAHIIWFLAAWTPIRAGVKDGPWLLPGNVTIRSPIGKILGLLALLVVILFVVAAVGLAMTEPWWAAVTEISVFLSFGAVVPWLRQSPGSTPINAIVANIALMFLLAVDLSVELTA